MCSSSSWVLLTVESQKGWTDLSDWRAVFYTITIYEMVKSKVEHAISIISCLAFDRLSNLSVIWTFCASLWHFCWQFLSLCFADNAKLKWSLIKTKAILRSRSICWEKDKAIYGFGVVWFIKSQVTKFYIRLTKQILYYLLFMIIVL